MIDDERGIVFARPMLHWLLTAALLQPADDEPAPPLTLSWDAPEACSDAATVEAQVRERLRGRPQPALALVADGRIEARDARFAMTLSLTHDEVTSTREFEATTCEEVVETALLLIVMTLDPLAIPA